MKERILAGHYAEDQFIRQDLIAQELGVSRIPVREALALLEAEGLVIREKFRGAVVPRLSAAEIEEIYALRGLLEPYLLEEAIARITPEIIDTLDDIVERSRRASDKTEWAGLNVEFHRTLYEAADRPLTLQMLDKLLVRADRYLKMQRFMSPQTQQESDAEHMRILDCIKAGDKDGALESLRQHIRWNAVDVRRTVGFDS
ncbi:GntR family transcriptional regulator [Sphingomonas colocasiae]|uniref:GntR family transcriptional regulator n=1 Tax=Sphingomonas colocasiae TaxID=1848973 RepID=A0ABS7PUR3_9SPHN|nr:GntR family transcriptional regulator [Sphingomonas colocasiae]